MVEFLNDHRESGVEAGWRVYGPFDDNGGRDIAWLVRINGTDLDTSFEFLLAPRGTTNTANFELMADGALTVDDEMRSGNVHIDFDTVESYPELDLTLLWEFEGDINIEFERNVDSGEKTISIDYDKFVATRTGFLDDDVFESDETYEYYKAGDGSGTFHLALMGEWDTYPYGWSGPMQERLQLDMVWNAGEAGRARGAITEVDGVGDMKHGDLSLDECFDAAGRTDLPVAERPLCRRGARLQHGRRGRLRRRAALSPAARPSHARAPVTAPRAAGLGIARPALYLALDGGRCPQTGLAGLRSGLLGDPAVRGSSLPLADRR